MERTIGLSDTSQKRGPPAVEKTKRSLGWNNRVQCLGIMEKKMETILMGLGIMEKKMEATKVPTTATFGTLIAYLA